MLKRFFKFIWNFRKKKTEVTASQVEVNNAPWQQGETTWFNDERSLHQIACFVLGGFYPIFWEVKNLKSQLLPSGYFKYTFEYRKKWKWYFQPGDELFD